MGIIRNLAKSYHEHDCFNLAANLSFFAILSLIPLLMITVSIAGYVMGSSQTLFSQIVSTVTDVLPKGSDEFASNLSKIVAGRSQVGGAGVVFLIFAASLLFTSLENAFDRIFQIEKRRNFFHSRLLSVALIFGGIAVIFLPTLVGLFEAALHRFGIVVPLSDLAQNRFFYGLLLVAAFVLAVKIIPNHNVCLKFAIPGGIFFAVGIVVAKYLFRLYIGVAFDRFNVIYGSLTVLVVSVLWIYYLSNVLLLAGELVAVLQRKYARN